MFRDLANQVPSLLPIISTVLCFGIFLFVSLYVLTDRRRGHLRAMEHLPLDDGKNRHV